MKSRRSRFLKQFPRSRISIHWSIDGQSMVTDPLRNQIEILDLGPIASETLISTWKHRSIFKNCAVRPGAVGALQSEPQPCVATVLAILQDNCLAHVLSSHFCRKTVLRSHCPGHPLCCVASELRLNFLRRIMRRVTLVLL